MSDGAAARELGWGLVGASLIGSEHVIPAIAATPGNRVVGAYSSVFERGESYARANGFERAFRSLEELLADPEVDVVYVSTTNDLHAAQTIAAARAGKHVLAEKPLALTFDDAVAMRDACSAAGVVMGTNHHLRCAATHQAMKRLIAEGAIGEVLAARVFHAISLPDRMRGWRIDGDGIGAGPVLDITVHDTDTLRFLLADEVEEVTALSAAQGLATAAGVEDAVMGVMRMAGGALVSFHDAYTLPHSGTGLEVHGTEASLISKEVMTPTPDGDVWLRRGDELEPVELAERWDLYEYGVGRFAAAVRGEGTPAATGEDGIASLAVALAALESAASERAVRVPPVPAAAPLGGGAG